MLDKIMLVNRNFKNLNSRKLGDSNIFSFSIIIPVSVCVIDNLHVCVCVCERDKCFS